MRAFTLLCFAAALACCSCAVIGLNDLDSSEENVDVLEGEDVDARDSAGTNFKLYTKQNPNSPIAITAANLNSVKNFNAHRATKFVVHGWQNSAGSLDDIRAAYVRSGGDYNIVMVDWSVGAASNYISARRMVIQVGQTVAELIAAMEKLGANKGNIQITGHSLGAHIAGIASDKAGRVGKVVGLDPAAPGFGTVAASGRLDRGDANFVQVIHTDAGALGWRDPLGQADFYPNGGTMIQPGCGAVACSHGRANQFFAESITSGSGFWGTKCSNWSTFTSKRCAGGAEAVMGENTPTSASGSYYLRTGRSSPFALGKAGASA